ncbi:MAG: terminase family protein [Clostridia bacterium]|nr:terminase family protein [Clostridia bacterium]
MNIIWTPQPRQRAFMQRKETEALYGGAAGGGKSDCAIAEALRQVHIPHYRGLILRKTYPQLSEMVDRSREIYSPAFPEAKFNDQKHCWTFPSGAKIYFGAMQHTKDRTNYQGKRYDFIDFDELTHFTWDEYSYLFSRNRPNGPGTRCYIRAQANPGGIGHGWVKERFITPAPPMTPIYDEVKIMFPDGKSELRRQNRIFVPSSVFDNKILMQNDPDYITRLASLPENEKKALLYGDWDSFSGQVFTEWRNNPDGYENRRNTHVINPFKIPSSWKIYRGFDFGYSRPFSVGWYCVDHDGRLYRIKELYGCTGTPNEGVRWEPSRIAREIKRIENEDINLRGKYVNGIADPSIFDESRGESVGRLMEREGVYFEKADNTRIAGKMQLHNRFAFDDEGVPMLYIFSTCKHFIRTVPALVYSQVDVEDIDTTAEDHIYDEVRYIAMANPINPPPKKQPQIMYDPLSTDDYKHYNYYRLG